MAIRPQVHLTAARLRVARLLAAWECEERPAFVPQLSSALGFPAESSLTDTLRRMKRDGFIEICGGGVKGRPRLVQLTTKGRMALEGVGIPVLGEVSAGPLSEALAEPPEFIANSNLLQSRPGDFLLRAKGDSMIGDGILSGDLVLLRPGVEVARGEIAAVHAREDYEGTLKHVFVEADHVRLRASNPAYQDIVVPAKDWRGVAGVYRGLVRKLYRN